MEVRKVGRRRMPLTHVRDYELLEKIGRGGMGVVYKARHVRLGKVRALKLLPLHFATDESAIARFEREIEHCGRLEHPNIVQAIDAGVEGDVPFLVMEYVEGCDLESLVQRRGPFTVGAACEIIRQVACGLRHADDLFMIHRDIKPANLMLSNHGIIKILDFGLARFVAEQQTQERLTAANRPMGSAYFMAPEQWADASSVDIRADIYGLGCTLYYLCTGGFIFDGSTVFAILLAHRDEPAPSLSDKCPNVPPELDRLYERMVAKSPEERVGSPAEVAEAIAPFARRDELRPYCDEVAEIVREQTATPPPSHQPTGSPGSTRRDVEPNRPAPRRRFLLPALSVLMLAAAAGLAGLLFVPDLIRPRPPEDIIHVATMPGLRGGWWFDETPWFLPPLRAQWIDQWRTTKASLGDEQLRAVVAASRLPDVLAYYDVLESAVAASEDNLTGDERALVSDIRNLASLQSSGDGKWTFRRTNGGDGNDNWMDVIHRHAARAEKTTLPQATIWHTLAICAQKLSLKDEAESFYRRALDAYEREDKRDLTSLCSLDWARWSLAQRDYVRCVDCSTQALKSSTNPATRIVALCLMADAYRKENNAARAFELLDQADAIPGLDEAHPLKAHILERRAWTSMDSWKFSQAIEQFRQAMAVRSAQERANDESSESEFILWSRQGVAMAHHFLGNHDEALSDYEALRSEIPDAGIAVNRQPPLRGRTERGPNTLERLADCYLFQPRPDYDKAAQLLAEASRQSEYLDFHKDHRAPYVLRQHYKRVLALALTDPAKAEQEFDQLHPVLREAVDRLENAEGRGAPPFALAKASAMAMIDFRSKDEHRHQTGRRELMNIVRRSESGGLSSGSRITRTNIELILLAMEQLYVSQELDQNELLMLTREFNKVAGTACSGDDSAITQYLQRFFVAAEEELRRSLKTQPNDDLQKELQLIQTWPGRTVAPDRS